MAMMGLGHFLFMGVQELSWWQRSKRACHYLRAMAIWGLWATHTDWQRIPGAERG